MNVVSLLLIAVMAQAEAPTMRLCVGSLGAAQQECSLLPDAASISSAGREGQAFVFFRPAARELGFGVFDGSEPKTNVQLMEVIVENGDRVPSIAVMIADSKIASNRWSFTARPRELHELRGLRLPAGHYRVTLRAPHYRDATAELNGVVKKRIQLVLRRLPAITGRVLGPTGEPLPNASVQPLPGNAGCATDFDGAFRCEIDGQWPASISASYPRLAKRVIALGSSERETNVGDIRLSNGARLTVRVEAPDDVRSVVATLFHDDEGKPAVQIAERTLSLPSNEGAVMSELNPGVYRLLVRGSRPYQQHASKVSVRGGDNETTVSIDESELTLRVLSESHPQAGASILLKNLEGRWSGTVQTNESGTAVEPLWQLGEFSASVRPKKAASPVMDHHVFSPGARQQWTFQVPIGRIEGRVADEGGSPVAEALVSLTTDSGDMTSALRTKTDSSGRYAFDGVRPGAQTVAAQAEGYLPSDSVAFRLVESETGRNVDVTLRRGARKSVEVVDARGVPLPNSTVLESVNNILINMSKAGGDGSVEVQLPAAVSPVLFVIPPNGSFAIHRVSTIERDSASIRILVPDATASLELKTETTEHQPVRDVHFLVRYDGETIPFDVLMFLAQVFGVDFKTGADGSGMITNLPPGAYELWPYAKTTDIETLMSGFDMPAPLRVALTQGVSSATLSFRAKRR